MHRGNGALIVLATIFSMAWYEKRYETLSYGIPRSVPLVTYIFSRVRIQATFGILNGIPLESVANKYLLLIPKFVLGVKLS